MTVTAIKLTAYLVAELGNTAETTMSGLTSETAARARTLDHAIVAIDLPIHFVHPSLPDATAWSSARYNLIGILQQVRDQAAIYAAPSTVAVTDIAGLHTLVARRAAWRFDDAAIAELDALNAAVA